MIAADAARALRERIAEARLRGCNHALGDSVRADVIAPADYALVGGGLQNGLIALAVRAHQPAARIVMIERGATLGGNHTWCFHAGDIDDDRAAWIAPLVVKSWPGYDVAFPAHARRLDSTYACVTSDRLAEVVARSLAHAGSEVRLRCTALEVGAEHVVVRAADGRTEQLSARVVIDARGPDASESSSCGWQKFVGQELELDRAHGLDRPMLMDATVSQLDGFRFVYVLPLDTHRVLVEDTYFSDHPYLDVGALRERIAAYVGTRGWIVERVVREEVGVLPLPWVGASPVVARPLVAGYAGGWFHPVTGYSFPIASRLASLIARAPSSALFDGELDAHATDHTRQLRFAHQLNHMLFHWFAPADRYRVLERFYRLPEATIRRFYALELTSLDRVRILLGRPPRGVSVRRMLGMEVA